MDGRENLRRIEGLSGGRANLSVCTPFKIRDIMIGHLKSVSGILQTNRMHSTIMTPTSISIDVSAISTFKLAIGKADFSC